MGHDLPQGTGVSAYATSVCLVCMPDPSKTSFAKPLSWSCGAWLRALMNVDINMEPEASEGQPCDSLVRTRQPPESARLAQGPTLPPEAPPPLMTVPRCRSAGSSGPPCSAPVRCPWLPRARGRCRRCSRARSLPGDCPCGKACWSSLAAPGSSVWEPLRPADQERHGARRGGAELSAGPSCSTQASSVGTATL
jgi:hypothetical protein